MFFKNFDKYCESFVPKNLEERSEEARKRGMLHSISFGAGYTLWNLETNHYAPFVPLQPFTMFVTLNDHNKKQPQHYFAFEFLIESDIETLEQEITDFRIREFTYWPRIKWKIDVHPKFETELDKKKFVEAIVERTFYFIDEEYLQTEYVDQLKDQLKEIISKSLS